MVAPLPAGLAPVFAGWNVWDLYQTTDPDESILGKIWHAGIAPDQLAKLWVENQIEKNAPGADVSDPLNPNPEHFRGDEIQILPAKPTGLAIAAGRESAGLGGTQHLGTEDAAGEPIFRSVRFYNRGAAAVMPWPHDANFLVDVVYQPSTTNPLTNSAPPSTAGGALKDAAEAAARALNDVVTVVAWGAGAVALIMLLSKVRSSR